MFELDWSSRVALPMRITAALNVLSLVLSLEWNINEVVHSESGDNDGDDDEPVGERSDDGGKGSSSTGWRSSLGS